MLTSPANFFFNQKIKTMKLINYKETHFNLIIDKDHPLYPKTEITNEIPFEKCKHCQKCFTEPHKMNNHIRKCQEEKVSIPGVASNVESIETLTKKVKRLELDLKDFEEKIKRQ